MIAEKLEALKIKKAALQRRRQQLINLGSEPRLMDRLISNCDKVKNALIQQSKQAEATDVSPESQEGARGSD